MTNYSLNAIPDTWKHYEHPWYTQLQLQESTTTSESLLQQKPKSETTGQKFTDPNRKGDLAEHYVALMATWKGAEVYRNINCTGKVDLVIGVDGILYRLDVKLAALNGRGDGWSGQTNKVKPPVIPVLVIPDGDIFEWKIQWIRNRHPKELENFWKKPTTNGNKI